MNQSALRVNYTVALSSCWALLILRPAWRQPRRSYVLLSLRYAAWQRLRASTPQSFSLPRTLSLAHFSSIVCCMEETNSGVAFFSKFSLPFLEYFTEVAWRSCNIFGSLGKLDLEIFMRRLPP